MGLGPLHTIDLEEARERARQARKALLDGADPLALRAAEAAQRALEAARSITFEKAAQRITKPTRRAGKTRNIDCNFGTACATMRFLGSANCPLPTSTLGWCFNA
jgi:hypothetical protein